MKQKSTTSKKRGPDLQSPVAFLFIPTGKRLICLSCAIDKKER